MLIMLTQMRLQNVANFCYCNATMFSLWWALLNRQAYQFGDWGASQDTMNLFFSRMDASPISVPQFFTDLFSQWDHATKPADAAEFTYFVLQWMNSPCFSHRWERTYVTENVRHLHDFGDLHAPLFLQVPNPHVTSVDLSSLLTRWTQEYGMDTLLLDAPDILICHVDRTATHADGTVEKLHFWLHADTVCTLPTMHPDGDKVDHEYVPISMLAHLGDVQGGHYRAALRLTVEDGRLALSTQNTLWALTDDSVAPEIYQLPGLPDWFCKNITLICLVRLACVGIYRPLRDPGSERMRLNFLRKQVARNLQQLSEGPSAAVTDSLGVLQDHSSDPAPAAVMTPIQNTQQQTAVPAALMAESDQMADLMRLMRNSTTYP
eukprot:s1179_g17.t1